MKCKDCKDVFCSHRTVDAEKECYKEKKKKASSWPAIQSSPWNSWGLSQKRQDIATAILVALISKDPKPNPTEAAIEAVDYADELIAKLTENDGTETEEFAD